MDIKQLKISEESRLFIVIEGTPHDVQYFFNHGVYPNTFILDPSRLAEVLYTIQPEDDILFIVKGLTHFSLREVYETSALLEQVQDKVNSVVILTNVALGTLAMEYYTYKGDLFYGDVFKTEKGKLIQIFEEGDNSKLRGKTEKIERKKPNPQVLHYENPLLKGYKQYRQSNQNLSILGKNLDTVEEKAGNQYTHEEKLIILDIFN